MHNDSKCNPKRCGYNGLRVCNYKTKAGHACGDKSHSKDFHTREGQHRLEFLEFLGGACGRRPKLFVLGSPATQPARWNLAFMLTCTLCPSCLRLPSAS